MTWWGGIGFNPVQSISSNFGYISTPGGGGGTHIFGRTGMCRSNGSLFYKKSLNMGPVFLPKKSLNMGQLFWLSPKLRDVRGFRQNPKIAKFLKNRPTFEGKSLKMGTLFGQITLKDGYGFWGSSGKPLSNSNLSTPRDFDQYHFICILIMDCAKLCMCKQLYFDKFYFFQ